MKERQYSLGLYPSQPHWKDYMYACMVPIRATFPSKFSLESYLVHTVPDQGSFGTCVGQAAKRGKEQQEFLNHPLNPPELSAAFAYTEAKKIDGIPGAGTTLKAMMQVLYTKGICEEALMPYSTIVSDTGNLPVPSAAAYANALNYKIKSYAKITTLAEMKQAIFNKSYLMSAIYVFDSTCVPEDGGFVPIPGTTDKTDSILGGHGIPFLGWDDNLTHTYADGTTCTGFIRAGNSWGPNWGDNGFFWIPYQALTWRSDTVPFWIESWSNVDVIMPDNHTTMLELWIDQLKATWNGAEETLDVAPMIYNSRTMLPIRYIAERLGCKVYWNGVERKVTIVK